MSKEIIDVGKVFAKEEGFGYESAKYFAPAKSLDL